MRATLPEGALSSEPTAVPLYAGGRLLVAFTGVAPGRAPAIVVARLGPLGRVLLRTTIATGGVLDDAASAVTDARVALTWSVPRAAGGVDAFATWWTPEATFDPTELTLPGEADLPGGRIVVFDVVNAVGVRGLVQAGAGALTAASEGQTDDSAPRPESFTSMTTPTPNVDRRFSDPSAGPTAWADAERVLVDAELYWLTTVRADGRPHVTPLIGVFHDGAMHFCTGRREQKHRNLDANPRVALTTGANAWAVGTDVVVEGDGGPRHGSRRAARLGRRLRRQVRRGLALRGRRRRVRVRRGRRDASSASRPTKVLAFAKDPHAQTTFRFGGR